ncbi:MAG: Plug domain-containing protein, partial [Desulfobacterales bacterium]|nr:Plug domain-containing protein [Desulfobacterales bacterium]
MKRFILFVVIFFCGFLLVVSSVNRALAQNKEEEIHELEEVVVTATRDMKVLDTPASISVITARDLEEQGIINIGDAIARIPGAYDDGASKYYFSMRGTRSSSAGGPLVLIDGVPQNVGMSGYNYLETIPVSDIER